MNDFALIRDRADITEIASRFITLTRRGRTVKGLCPFHSDSVPSFHIHEERQRYKCFSCQASGDTVDLYKHLYGINHTGEAITRLKADYGLVDGGEIEEGAKNREAERDRHRKRIALRDVLTGEMRRLKAMAAKIGLAEVMMDAYGDVFHRMCYIEAKQINLENDAYTYMEIEELLDAYGT